MSIFKRINPKGDDRGVTMVEYGLLVAVIALIASSTVMMMGHETEKTFDTIAESIDEAHGGSGSAESAASASDSSSDGEASEEEAEEETEEVEETEEEAEEAEEEAEEEAQEEAQEAEEEAEEAEEEAEEEAQEEAQEAEEEAEEAEEAAEGTEEETEETAEETEEEADLDGTVQFAEANASFTSWNKWAATVTYSNDWDQDQYLTLEVTRTRHNGSTQTVTVNGFEVPAGSTATFEDGNNLLISFMGKEIGVTEIQVEVTKITTSDHGGNTVEYNVDGPVTTIEAPSD